MEKLFRKRMEKMKRKVEEERRKGARILFEERRYWRNLIAERDRAEMQLRQRVEELEAGAIKRAKEWKALWEEERAIRHAYTRPRLTLVPRVLGGEVHLGVSEEMVEEKRGKKKGRMDGVEGVALL